MISSGLKPHKRFLLLLANAALVCIPHQLRQGLRRSGPILSMRLSALKELDQSGFSENHLPNLNARYEALRISPVWRKPTAATGRFRAVQWSPVTIRPMLHKGRPPSLQGWATQ